MRTVLEISSALPLFVAWVLADDAHHSLAADHAAGFTQFLDGSTDFHGDFEK
jgi:hypothetical protein